MGGLNTILTFESRLKETQEQLENGSLMETAVIAHEAEIIKANQEQLYEYGQNPLGLSLGEYTPITKKIKIRRGQPIDRVTLYDTGEFYAGFRVLTDNTGFSVTSDDWKTEELLKRWGSIFGLTIANRLHLAWSLLFPDLRYAVAKLLYGI